MSQLTYQTKPAFHPENCRQPEEEPTWLVQSVRPQTVTTALVCTLKKLTDRRDPPLALATVSFSFSAARRWTAWKLLRAAEKSLMSRSLWIFCCLWRSTGEQRWTSAAKLNVKSQEETRNPSRRHGRAHTHREERLTALWQPLPKRTEEPVMEFIWTNEKNHLELKKTSVGKEKESIHPWTLEEDTWFQRQKSDLWYSPALKVMKTEGWNPTASGAYLSPLPAGWWSVGSAVCGHTVWEQPSSQQHRHKSTTALTHASINISLANEPLNTHKTKRIIEQVFSWNLWSK